MCVPVCVRVHVRVRVHVCMCVADSEKAHVGTSSLSGKKFQKEASWKLFQEVSIWETSGLEAWQRKEVIMVVVL